MKYSRLESAAREYIDHARDNNKSVVTTLQGFTTKHDFLVLKDLLLYAMDQGVTVIIEAPPKKVV